MKTQMVDVTPKLAREWLRFNTNNRPLRPSHVEALRASFERGEYVFTHQGIAFDSDGAVADGQHRLTAISLLPDGWSFPMLVTRGLDRETAFPVIDAVQAKRSTSDVLGIDGGLGYVGNFFARVYAGRSNGITPVYVAPFARWAQPEYEELVLFCPASCKTWSSAPVRAAAIVSMKTGIDSDYVKLMYSSLVRADFSAMPPVVQALYRAHQSGNVRASAAFDIMVRCIRAFDPKNAKNSRVQIKEPAIAVAQVRDLIHSEIFEAKKKALTSSARKSVSAANYPLRAV
jgi:hypothetical protein